MTMEVTNYSHIEEAHVMSVEGERYAIQEDEHGYVTILNGTVCNVDGEKVFRAYSQRGNSYIQVPRHQLERALSQI